MAQSYPGQGAVMKWRQSGEDSGLGLERGWVQWKSTKSNTSLLDSIHLHRSIWTCARIAGTGPSSTIRLAGAYFLQGKGQIFLCPKEASRGQNDPSFCIGQYSGTLWYSTLLRRELQWIGLPSWNLRNWIQGS